MECLEYWNPTATQGGCDELKTKYNAPFSMRQGMIRTYGIEYNPRLIYYAHPFMSFLYDSYPSLQAFGGVQLGVLEP